ncbi:lipocalin family protein [Mesorhizobium sp. ZMM04-4]
MQRQTNLAIIAIMAVLAGCAGIQAVGGGAPEPRKIIEMDRFYSGTWLEVARRPMLITVNCPAGSTTYRRNGPTTVYVFDACEVGIPGGRQRSIDGEGTILDPGTNAKLIVRYAPLVSREYWIIDRADDYSWFIEASPDFRDLYIFTRKVPSRSQLSRLVARAEALGYDVSRLEFPAQPPNKVPKL